MQTKQTIRNALVSTISAYSQYLNYAVTLTLKQRAKVKVQRFENYNGEYNEFYVQLTEDIALNTLNYFNARLTHYAYGKAARKNISRHYSQPLVIATLEGKAVDKRLHLHLAIGNLPTQYTHIANEWISKAWEDCDFAYKQKTVRKLTDTYGWLDYMAKETNIGNEDVFCIANINEPQSIKELVGSRKLL